MHRRDENFIQPFLRKVKKKYYLEDLVLGAGGKRLIKIGLRETICEDWIRLA